jgi:hypothetical protein
MTLESIEKLRELAADINSTEVIDHLDVVGKFMFHSEWLDSWHKTFDAACDEIEREIAERFMELPTDADGVPIHPGNYVELDGKGGEVWLVGTTDVMCSDGMSYRAVAVSHRKQRTLEDVLSDFADELNASHSNYISIDGEKAYTVAAINETADEIRELLGVKQ